MTFWYVKPNRNNRLSTSIVCVKEEQKISNSSQNVESFPSTSFKTAAAFEYDCRRWNLLVCTINRSVMPNSNSKIGETLSQGERSEGNGESTCNVLGTSLNYYNEMNVFGFHCPSYTLPSPCVAWGTTNLQRHALRCEEQTAVCVKTTFWIMSCTSTESGHNRQQDEGTQCHCTYAPLNTIEWPGSPFTITAHQA